MNYITTSRTLINYLETAFNSECKLSVTLLDNRHIQLNFEGNCPISQIHINTVELQKLLGEFTNQLLELKEQLHTLKNETK